MKLNSFKLLIPILLVIYSCSPSKKLAQTEPNVMPEVRVEILDTMEIVPDADHTEIVEEVLENVRPRYQSAETQLFDLINTKLDIRFDWEKQHVLGSAVITSSPHFYAQEVLELDAKGFDIHGIQLGGQEVQYDYDGSRLNIHLGKSFNKNEKVVVTINYTAKPDEGDIGGSEAITSDKGLYFINPLGEVADKPMQIWTQGETESNSKWFPTIDSPNQRCSQEISITVEDKYSTLSNGLKTTSKQNLDGTRTDTWVQKQPHAPYLFMMAVGEYAWVEDKWNDLPLYYIVEKEYEDDAKDIFAHTPEMLTFFSDILMYPYPWDKYAQIVTRDYVSGAMENTSAVIFGDFVQKHKRELIDEGNDYIVAHEMFHHWFGDLVTIESWANLTLNEGFANYSEYLWFEHKYGKDRADEHRVNEMTGYLTSATEGVHPLIHYGYGQREDMFDAHSYNKGGLVLHMLRSYLGDEAFFQSLNTYLNDNKYSSVEVDELRMAFEDVSGEDLNWFFDQWYLMEGHPELNVSYSYDEENNIATAIVEQKQKDLYRIPFDMNLYFEDGSMATHRVWMNNRFDTLNIIGVEDKPGAMVLDGRNDQLAIISEQKDEAAYVSQFKNSKEIIDRLKSIQMLGSSDKLKEIVLLGIEDKNHLVRSTSLDLMDPEDVIANAVKLENLAVNDPHSGVRIAALGQLFVAREGAGMDGLLDLVLTNEQSYSVLSEAIGMIANQDVEKAEIVAQRFENEKTDVLANGIAYAYSQTKNDSHFDWFYNKVKNGNFYDVYPIYTMFSGYLANLDNSLIKKGAQQFADIAIGPDEDINRKFIAMNALATLRGVLSEGEVKSDKIEAINFIGELIADVKSKEVNPLLLSQYSQY